MQDQLYWGWRLLDWATLFAILFGPVFAVGLSLAVDARRNKRTQQIQTMRMLISTRHLAGDPSYSSAINLIPIEFNGQPKIMNAWRDYIEVVRYAPTPENEAEHFKTTVAKQTTLVFQILKHLKYDLSETDIQTSAYASGALIERDNLAIDAYRAWRDIATALQRQNELTAQAIMVSKD